MDSLAGADARAGESAMAASAGAAGVPGEMPMGIPDPVVVPPEPEPPGETPLEPPNIVLILADDLGYETVRAYGGTSYSTPNLDQLAATGMRFANGHAQPLCTPSRVKLMTGRFNYQNYEAFMMLPQGEMTFANLARAAEYKTIVAGKWQLVDGGGDWSGWEGPPPPPGQYPDDAGFDEHCVWQLHRYTRGSRYWDPTLTINGELTTFDANTFGPDVMNQCLLDFIERNQSERFFAYYPMVLPHDPFVTTPDALNATTNQERFAAMVAYMDKLVGKVISKLYELELRDDTLVIFLGDNGTSQSITSMLGDVSIRGGKGKMTEAGTHVPWIVSWPGKVPVAVNQHIYDFTAIVPTLAELMQADTAGVELDGRSIWPDLQGEPPAGPNVIYEFYEPLWGNFTPGQFARTPRFKLNGDGNYFDIDVDALEQMNLQSGSAPQMAEELRAELQNVLDSMGTTLNMAPAVQ